MEDLPAAPGALHDSVIGLAVALGAGLLVGIERERRKGEGDDRQAAGLRSFVVAALTGALAQALRMPALVAVGAAFIAALAALSYWKSRSRDPGLTTELALFATYLIGVLSGISPALAAGCGAGLAALLAARERLHLFATRLLTEQEVHDGLLLAALALVVLPLIPSQPLAVLAGMNPRPLAALVVLIMALQAAGQMALRWMGPRSGLLVSGFVSGFVSSTATIASLGSTARAQPARAGMLAGGAAMSATATWVQALLMSALLAPAAAWALLPAAAAGAVGAAACALWMARSAPGGDSGDSGSPASSAAASSGSALRPREALIVALMLGLVAVAVAEAQRRFGDTGVGIGVALAALADAHAPIASLASLQAAGALPVERMGAGVLLAISANTLTRCGVALVAGGGKFVRRVAGALLVSLALAWLTGWWTLLR